MRLRAEMLKLHSKRRFYFRDLLFFIFANLKSITCDKMVVKFKLLLENIYNSAFENIELIQSWHCVRKR